MKLPGDLKTDEIELIQGMFADRITTHREMARMEHTAGMISEAELKWHLDHADYTQEVYEKLFGVPYQR